MRIGFVAPDLRRLDALRTDALALPLHEGEVPLPDLRGLIDWRLCGALSRLAIRGRLRGDDGETLLMPVGARFPFQRLLVFGLGPIRRLDPDEVAGATGRMLDTLARLRVHAAALALPGRPFGGGDPILAAETLLQLAPHFPDLDEITLVESTQAQRLIGTALDVGRRL